MGISSTAVVRPGVLLGEDSSLGSFVVVGEGEEVPAPPTVIGDGARLRSHTVIYAGVRAGARLQTGHAALIREHTCLGDDVSIGSHAILEHHVKVGHRVRVHSGAFVPEYCVLEDDCWIGPRAVLTNAAHPRCVNMPDCLEGVTVRRGAKIGANATLLPGVEIGENALVGAGAVVTGNVEAGTVVAGNPARVMGMVADLTCTLDRLTKAYPG